ncbi:MAG: hypothetical protein PHC95_00105 [Parabacteroides sp.]|nr:hypothetical protein [Parabacteroides sp.]
MTKFTLTKATILFLLSGILVACGNDKWEFDFEKGDHGEWTLPNLEPLSKTEFEQEIVGYGWKWIDTYEIEENGKLAQKPYWEDMIGGSPDQYYFAKDSVTRFFWADAIPADCYWTTAYTYEEKGNQVSTAHGETSLQLLKLEDSKLEAIEYLGQRGDGIKVYGYSIYQRMSDEELEKCRKSYPTNFEDVWD